MNFEMKSENAEISTPQETFALTKADKLLPTFQDAVLGGNKSSELHHSLRWQHTQGLEGCFVGVLPSVTVYNAQALLPKELLNNFDWQIDTYSDTACIDTLVVAVSEDLLREMVSQAHIYQMGNILDVWVDYVLHVIFYKPGLELGTLRDAASKRISLGDLKLADFQDPIFLCEDEYTAPLHKVKLFREKRFANKGFQLDTLGSPDARMALHASICTH